MLLRKWLLNGLVKNNDTTCLHNLPTDCWSVILIKRNDNNTGIYLQNRCWFDRRSNACIGLVCFRSHQLHRADVPFLGTRLLLLDRWQYHQVHWHFLPSHVSSAYLIVTRQYLSPYPSLSYCCCLHLAHRGGRINVDNLIAGVDWSTQKAIELPEFKVTTSYPPQSPFIKKSYSIPCVVSWIDTYSTLSRRPFSDQKPTGGVLGLQVIYSNVYLTIPLN